MANYNALILDSTSVVLPLFKLSNPYTAAVYTNNKTVRAIRLSFSKNYIMPDLVFDHQASLLCSTRYSKRKDTWIFSSTTDKSPCVLVGITEPQNVPFIKLNSLDFVCEPSEYSGTLTVSITRSYQPKLITWYSATILPGQTSLSYENLGRSLVSPGDIVTLSYTNPTFLLYTGKLGINYN